MSYRVEDLSGDFHETDAFDCGRERQNDFLRDQAWQSFQAGHSKTFVAVEESVPKLVCGFYTLSMGNVEFENAPEQLKDDWLPDYPIPTALLGQMGVDEGHQGNRLGEFLLVNAIARASVAAEEAVGAAAVEVHAVDETARSFFEKYGFNRMPDDENHLYLSMDIADEIAEQAENVTLSGQLVR
jgi:ribosomal protein S18 acetylase RimI-like enzyme